MRLAAILLEPKAVIFLQVNVDTHVLLVLTYFQLSLCWATRNANEVLLGEGHLLVKLL